VEGEGEGRSGSRAEAEARKEGAGMRWDGDKGREAWKVGASGKAA